MNRAVAATSSPAKPAPLPVRLVRSAVAAFQRHAEYRRGLLVLSRMDDARLRDLGICRSDIEGYLLG